ncbi:hypothetical protein [Serratia plymuthica]|uniref:hypothetical protein n=1 Tax=Serratia plymuthica TaxID=82996 RepID=UPI0004567909|nr:hypothetical protein [Serratia plymuthica]AHY09908.1 hypothetical protein sch_10480 [Serratia plymuthica]
MDADKLFIGILSGTIAGGVAIFTNYWRTRYTIKAQDFSKRIEEIIKKIDSLEEISCKYWHDHDKSNNKIIESKIIGKQEQVSMLISHLEEQYHIYPLSKIEEKLTNLCDACTGADFSSENRNISNAPKYIRKVLICSEDLKIELYNSRLKKY